MAISYFSPQNALSVHDEFGSMANIFQSPKVENIPTTQERRDESLHPLMKLNDNC